MQSVGKKNIYLISLLSLLTCITYADTPIDRHALVTRHNPHLTAVDTLSPFSVGNGRFAFTADITGLQSFPEAYAKNGIPLSTQSEWGMHSFPNTEGYKIEDTMEDFDTAGRPVPYPTLQHTPAGQWLRSNPHRLGLGRIGFKFTKPDGTIATIDDLESIDQTLDLWTGTITSHFTFEGHTVEVQTVCHPEQDTIAVTAKSPLFNLNQLSITIRFPYGTNAWGIEPEDWNSPDKHTTTLTQPVSHTAHFHRQLDDDSYSVTIQYSENGTLEKTDQHEFALNTTGDTIEFTTEFLDPKTQNPEPQTTSSTAAASAESWQRFWQSGGAIDFSGSTDPRAHELERRVILSQYLTATQCTGDMPPQETGLTFNSWYGKPHLEMHWWHGVHFALWDRLENLERTLPWYQKILPKAQEIAHSQGYPGARWPKNVDNNGNQVPSTIAPLLIWQQPHPIYFAELAYRAHPDQATLEAYSELVFETAAFMAAYPNWNDTENRYNLGPPLIPAQESYDPKATSNPPFELAYWRWGLETAQAWRERLDQPRDADWDNILDHLAPYPHYDDLYATAEGIWNTRDHPTHLAIYGMLPGKNVDHDRLRRTLVKVLNEWPWEHTWGWDYPMIAMTAARLGEPELALKALFLDVQKNTYLPNGHNYQEPGNLRLYLPGNGGLLATVAMLAAGWDGAPDVPNPGFPKDGTWNVKWEGLKKMP